ncbi:sensor histidine kinase [Agromyces sp. MMS24-JH15]|uniref:sensor histidine kinase n=1 Tax=Agromyces sp. MMS24-JH15 TaxID=3243765 RepID=UPI0037492257
MPGSMPRAHWIVPAVAAAAFAVVGTLEIVLDPVFRAAPLAPAIVLALVVGGTLLAIRAPIAGTVVVASLFPVGVVLGLDGPTGVGVPAYFLLPGWAGYRRPLRRSWIAPLAAQLLATAGVAIGALLADAGDLAAAVWENLFFSMLAWASWAVGLLARSARDRAERAHRLAEALDAEREAREHAILVEERQRIAREIHDAVAHSVSVMTLQVGAVRSTLPPDAPQAEMLRGIERLGRESVAELRSVVGILRRADEAEPAAPPSLDRAGDLVDEVRAAGLDVAFTETGERAPLPRAVDVSAYRVLQESLTNVLRHAPGAGADVRIERSPERVVLEVRNGRADGADAAAPADGVGGHGLVGLRERLAMLDGRFEAGPDPDGGFAVRAEFPVGAAR